VKLTYITPILGLILSISFIPHVYAQTNFTKLFESDAYRNICTGLSVKFCYSPLTIVYESNNSIIAGVLEGGLSLIGDELDLLNKAGYKVHNFVPDVGDSALHYEQWVYLTK
jgi:hypothetical protein